MFMNAIEYVGVTKCNFFNQNRETVPYSVAPTPLIRLSRLSELTGCEILAKAEFLNPGGSVKYRTAVGIIKDAEAKGLLHPGDTIVEGSAGNTGIGLTIAGKARGYQTVIVVCETTSPEKIAKLRDLGARVVIVPARPEGHPENYNCVAQRLAREHGYFWANQFDNTSNRLAHYQTTGPQIWEQTGGRVSGFVSAVGTGGTLAGTSMYLREQNPNVNIVCADPSGGAMWSWFTRGILEPGADDSIAEGIGQTRVTGNLADLTVDRAYRIDDQTAVTIVYHLLREEGLWVGLSSGINVGGALRLALEGGPGQVIATILSDGGQNYRSRLFNNEWLKSHNLDSNRPVASVISSEVRAC